MEEEEKKDLVEDVKPEEQVVPVENQVVEEFKQESAHDVEVQDDVKEEKKVEETVVKETAITRENIISRLQEMVSDITLAKRPELESLKQCSPAKRRGCKRIPSFFTVSSTVPAACVRRRMMSAGLPGPEPRTLSVLPIFQGHCRTRS